MDNTLIYVREATVFVTSDALCIRPDPVVQARGAGSFKTDAKPSLPFLGPETDQPFGQTGRREVAAIEDLLAPRCLLRSSAENSRPVRTITGISKHPGRRERPLGSRSRP